MSQRTARTIARTLWVVVFVFGVTQIVLIAFTRNAAIQQFGFRGSEAPLSLGLITIGGLVASRRPENPLGWLFCLAAMAMSLQGVASEYAVFSLARHGGSLPLTRGLAWVQNFLWIFIVGPVASVGFLFFPSGKLLSRRWRPAAAYAVVATIVFASAMAFIPGQFQHLPVGFVNPYPAFKSLGTKVYPIFGAPFLLSLILSFTALVLRFRRGSTEERQQIKWLAFAAAFLVSAMVADGVIGTINQQGTPWRIAGTYTLLTLAGVVAASAIAVLKYRLYDIDLVINKTLVFAALAAFITLVYVAVVAGIGAIAGSHGRANLGLSILATAIVAVAIQPVRTRANRFANRVVFGERASPYEALSTFGERIAAAYSGDEVLPELARLMTEATAATRAAVWMSVGSSLVPAAAWPEDPSELSVIAIADDPMPAVSGFDHTYPVRHQGDLLGALTVSTPATEQLSQPHDKLLTDLASHAGLVLRNERLIAELQASRQRIVAAGDQERRRIERNLHDGAQQHLVALSVKLGLLTQLMKSDPQQAEPMLVELRSDATEALGNLRDLARGIYPPLLADQGLEVALRSQASKAPVPVEVETERLTRYPQDIEAAVYFCVLEALQNAGKYAGATSARVRLWQSNGRVSFSVTDDGAGFDAASIVRGAGLTNMSDRLEALGGLLEVRSQPGAGTTITGWVRARQDA